MAAFTGPGFDSTKFTCISGKSDVCRLLALRMSPFSAASTICAISAGASLDATETTPCPPTAISGNASASSPERTMKSSRTAAHISPICVMLPDASFTATMFFSSAMRSRVWASTFAPVRPGTLYTTMGSEVLSATIFVVLIEALGHWLVVIGRDREDAVRAGFFHPAHHVDDLARVVAAGAGEYRHLAVGLRDDELHYADLFLLAERRRLAGGATRREEVHAGLDLPARETPDCRLVERAVISERRDQRRAQTGKLSSHESSSWRRMTARTLLGGSQKLPTLIRVATRV